MRTYLQALVDEELARNEPIRELVKSKLSQSAPPHREQTFQVVGEVHAQVSLWVGLYLNP